MIEHTQDSIQNSMDILLNMYDLEKTQREDEPIIPSHAL
jgi:hypothetical protein